MSYFAMGKRSFLLLILLSIFIGRPPHLNTAWAAPQLKEGAGAGDCAACHGKESILPAGHEETKQMKLAQCVSCHPNGDPKGKPGTLWGKVPLGHLHRLSGVDCTACHGEARPAKPPGVDRCLSCHKDYKNASLQANQDVQNPHESHMGDLECGLCHHQHKKSENFCTQCHWWTYVVP